SLFVEAQRQPLPPCAIPPVVSALPALSAVNKASVTSEFSVAINPLLSPEKLKTNLIPTPPPL
ncbi:MAG: hypothetical protein ACP5QA_16685, partial [Phycisphaerae bacterium]